MALKIRLRRMGRKKAPTYRIVVAESSMPRDGRFVANIGHYNPRTEPVTLVVDRDKALAWLEKGAMPTDTTMSLLKRAGVFKPESEVQAAAAAAAEAVVETAKKAAKATGAGASKAAGKAKEVATDAVEAVTKAAGAAADAVQDAVEDAREAVTGEAAEAESTPEAAEAPEATAEAGETTEPAAEEKA